METYIMLTKLTAQGRKSIKEKPKRARRNSILTSIGYQQDLPLDQMVDRRG